MSTYEENLRRALKAQLDAGDIREVGSSDTVFAQLSKTYPVSGSKIDWKRVPGAIECTEDDPFLQVERFVEFFEEMRSRFGLTGTVLYVGDSATDFALAGTVEAFRRALPELVAIPQHHYVIGRDFSWCICLTMEGDMGFGGVATSYRH